MVTKEEFDLVEKRTEALDERLRVASMSLGDFSKKEMLEHIKAKDEVGKQLAEVQLYYLKKLKERR